jgi:hypothetical protein
MKEETIKMLLANNNSRASGRVRHERFVAEYLLDFDMVRAYKIVYCPNEDPKDEKQLTRAASKIFNSIPVQQILDREACATLAESRLERGEIVDRLHRVYLEAMRDRDYSSALSALDKLMKYYGMYVEHNKQKKYSAEDVAAIRAKLEAHGVSFQDVNRPLFIPVPKSKLDEFAGTTTTVPVVQENKPKTQYVTLKPEDNPYVKESE